MARSRTGPAMKPTRRCPYCRVWYTPHARTRGLQKACPKPTCQKKRRCDAYKNWRSRNPRYSQSRNDKIRRWTSKQHSYWKTYRQSHPEYVRKNRRQSLQRYEAKKALFAKQNAIQADPMRFLNAIRLEIARSGHFAKRNAIKDVLDGILDYLLYKETLHNETLSTPQTPPRYDGDPIRLSELGQKKTQSPVVLSDLGQQKSPSPIKKFGN